MTYINTQKGSEWHRWDLHIHTPYTKLSNSFSGENEQEIWNKYIDTLEESPVQAFGITDYFSCDNYFNLIKKHQERHPNSKKVFFPNIEFRLAEAISKNSDHPNLHVIFDNNESNCSEKEINKFLAALKTLGKNSSGVRISCSDLKTDSDYESASVSFEEICAALKGTFGDEKPYLLAFAANNDGIRSTDNKSPRKVRISDEIDKLCDLFLGNEGNKNYFLLEDRYESGEAEPKPVVSGSDAHSFNDLERLEGNVSGFSSTWIKANLTFRGLRQICFEPDARVFIGLEPPVEQRKAQQSTKFLSKLIINQIQDYDEANGQWFKQVEIPLNPELTAIIGNKGSGKSALVDIIGLLGESKQEDYFSFLSDGRQNKKFKQRGYAEKFVADLVWESSTKVTKRLDANVDKTKPEAIRYLPQNYFEQLTNDIEIEAFRREIEDVVFSHVDRTDRMEKDTFVELQEFKTQQSAQEISVLKAKLRELNIEIVRLEEQADPLFKKKLEEELNAKKDELGSLDNTKPSEVLKPETETPEQKKLSEKIAQLTKQAKQLEESERNTVEIIAQKKNKLQKLSSLQQSVSAMSAQIVSQKLELKSVCEELGLNIEAIVKAEINTHSIEEQSLVLTTEIQVLEIDNKKQFSNEIDFNMLASLLDLRAACAYIKERVIELKEQLDTPQRKYQTYLDKLAKWSKQREDIIGNEVEPRSGTIKHLESQISYIDKELSKKLLTARGARKEISEKIFSSKQKILTFYSELKQSVEAKLSLVRTSGFSVNINASFVLDQSFSKLFLDFIRKNRKGYFHGANDPKQALSLLLSEVEWNDFDSIYKFIEIAIKKMEVHDGEPLSIKEQVSDIKHFYDFLFSLEYFSARYELRLGGKNLNKLSPGEKGLLLLVFYLQLDKDDIPLVIDQPEDNLDNESIFTVLAQCIRDAKKNRQVILVTHNPNLAVGADAEQIIYVQLDKVENYKFTYESGAIENPRINQKIVDVLEGTQPAFIKRRLKYQI